MDADRSPIVEHAGAYRDVLAYPQRLLQVTDTGVRVAVTYRKTWDDGFGARGWKVDATVGDPEIIASTRETGERIDTSVFVHDILDHFLSGFGVSGHRSEAMALIQLAARTGSDPTPDYAQMVEEDILNGRVNGEPLPGFLPDILRNALPEGSALSGREFMRRLTEQFGARRLRELLVAHFFALGERGREHAARSRAVLGLGRNRQRDLGLALQALLEVIDRRVEHEGLERLQGYIEIDNRRVRFVQNPASADGESTADSVMIRASQRARSARVKP